VGELGEVVASKPHPNPVPGEQSPGLFRLCRGHNRPGTPEGEGLKKSCAFHFFISIARA
jgi:hypothetical protein